MEAANGGYVEVGELLLDACADPNTAPVPSSRDTALTIAADKGHERFVDMLVHRGAHIDARNKKGCTALWLACHGGHLETVQTLVKHGADVDLQDNRKMSPLMVAFRKGHVKVVQHMVQHVRQFPGDQELSRYLTTITEPVS
ncbi:ankyrin repeat protein [Ancylostoma duodenale]|uniref:Ankyrin repeat protein n=1 Tax=Ancylostoma duodenale TaxID=51022 RepID=A0A0C2H5J6_9BILA|nr:ankyrin repeat protein [Ancylostoma duodenale]